MYKWRENEKERWRNKERKGEKVRRGREIEKEDGKESKESLD